MSLYIESIAHYTPPKRLTNKDLESMVDTTDEWITTRTGIRERAIAESGVGSADLAYEASKTALEKAKLQANELDAILFATSTADMSFPASACLLQSKLEAGEITSLDINAVCSGYVYGIDVADGLLSTGRYKRLLLACSEKFSSIINYKDRSTCILFGDGAGSIILNKESGIAKIASVYTGANGDLSDLLKRPAGGSLIPVHEVKNQDDLYVFMNGKEVFKHAVRGMGMSAEITLERAGWNPEDVTWLVPHQANQRLIKAAAERLNMDMDKVVINIQNYGNMSAASIPVAMSEAQERFKPGDKILSIAFGAGFTWGGVAMEWIG